MSEIYNLYTRDILQINSTIIAGILILMTIGSFTEPTITLGSFSMKFWVAFTLIPFVISSILGLFMIIPAKTRDGTILQRNTFYKYSIALMAAGFSYLLFLLAMLAFNEWIH